MTAGLVYALGGVVLFAMGLAGVVLLSSRSPGRPKNDLTPLGGGSDVFPEPGAQLTHALRRILAFNLMGSGAFLVLVGLAQRDGGVDPVPQAMVLTGIVVAVAATALALALARRLHEGDHRDG